MKNNPKMIFIGIIVLILIVWALIPTKAPKIGSDFVGEIPENAVGECNIKAINLYSDFSGSMQGYINFSNMSNAANANNNLISATSTLLNKVETGFKVKSRIACGAKAYTKDEFTKALTDKTVFNGGTTYVSDLVKNAVKAANDTSMSIVLSDMVLSYGKPRLNKEKDPEFNKHQLDGLKSELLSAFTEAKNKGLDVMILQYLSDFNGNYYYNFTENINGTGAYRGKLLKDRPFYILLIGKKDALCKIIDSDYYKPTNHIYASFTTTLTKGDYQVKPKEAFWVVGIDKDAEGGFSTKVKDDVTTTFNITNNSFKIPAYAYVCNDSVYAEFNDNVSNAYGFVYNEKAQSLSFSISTKSLKSLPKNGEFDVTIKSKNGWYWSASIDDDVAKDPSELEGKTWAINKTIEAIKEVYFDKHNDDSQKIGSVKILFIKE